MFGDKKVEKKKTMVYKCNLNPTFNQVFEANFKFRKKKVVLLSDI